MNAWIVVRKRGFAEFQPEQRNASASGGVGCEARGRFLGQARLSFKNWTQLYGKCDAEPLEDLKLRRKKNFRMAEILLYQTPKWPAQP
jgi:hypothetical protein